MFPYRKIQNLLSAGDIAPTFKAKGDALEQAICTCFATIAGVSVIETNVLSDSGAQEIDICVWNERDAKTIPFFENVIFIECKNWEAPVNSRSIRDFVAKVRAAKIESGILVAANGITGDADEVTRGYDVIRQAFDSDRTKIYVITREQIESFRSPEDIVKLLRNIFQKILLRKNPY